MRFFVALKAGRLPNRPDPEGTPTNLPHIGRPQCTGLHSWVLFKRTVLRLAPNGSVIVSRSASAQVPGVWSEAMKYSDLAGETACATETGAVLSEVGQTVPSAASHGRLILKRAVTLEHRRGGQCFR
jgi:hypothetical protein